MQTGEIDNDVCRINHPGDIQRYIHLREEEPTTVAEIKKTHSAYRLDVSRRNFPTQDKVYDSRVFGSPTGIGLFFLLFPLPMGNFVDRSNDENKIQMSAIFSSRHWSSRSNYSNCSNMSWCSNPGIKRSNSSKCSYLIKGCGNSHRGRARVGGNSPPLPLIKLELFVRVFRPNTRVVRCSNTS